jgi:hypothetical protein
MNIPNNPIEYFNPQFPPQSTPAVTSTRQSSHEQHSPPLIISPLLEQSRIVPSSTNQNASPRTESFENLGFFANNDIGHNQPQFDVPDPLSHFISHSTRVIGLLSHHRIVPLSSPNGNPDAMGLISAQLITPSSNFTSESFDSHSSNIIRLLSHHRIVPLNSGIGRSDATGQLHEVQLSYSSDMPSREEDIPALLRAFNQSDHRILDLSRI